MSDHIQVRVNGVVVWENANPQVANVPAPDVMPAIMLDGRKEVELAAGQVQSFYFYHGGGMMELNVSAVPGRGTFNTLTDSLVGPGVGFTGRQTTPAGTLKRHDAVKEFMPPGTYTYSVSADIATVLHVQKIQ